MQGIISTERSEMVDRQLGLAVADRIVGASHFASRGVNASVGAYYRAEFLELAAHRSAVVGQVIHVEDCKLYFDAKLSSIRARRLSPGAIALEYSSTRRLADWNAARGAA